MIPSFIVRDGMGAALAVAVVRAPGQWEDDVLEVAVEALEYAKQTAPWADRTGNARAGLDVDVDRTRDEIVMTMFHTVDYGKWLELVQSGKYAVIMPTLERFGPEIKRRIEGR